MDLNFCCSGERPPKGGERFAKSLNIPTRLDVCDIVFMLVSYSCTHTTIEQAPAHPPMKHELFKKNMFIGEKSAKGSRKVGERRVCQDPTLAQNGLVCLAMLPLQKPFKVFSTCVSVVGQGNL